jgi:4-hydroxy-2-oxoheptanedioate aldolase
METTPTDKRPSKPLPIMAINGTYTNGDAPKTNLGMAAYRAPSLLQPHRARQALADAHSGKIGPLVAFYCGLASPPIAKIVAQMGFDMVWIDWEHAAMGVETMNQVTYQFSV